MSKEEAATDKDALTESIARLDETAKTLSVVLAQVDRNQTLLLTLQHVTYDNKSAISKASTKGELFNEVKRQTIQRKRDSFRNKALIYTCTFLCLVLIGATAITLQEFKNSRHDANVAYSQSSKEVCIQRSVSWDAIQEWIKTQEILLAEDTVTNQSLKGKRMAAYDKMLKSFPDVNCAQLGTGLATNVPKVTSEGNYTNLANKR